MLKYNCRRCGYQTNHKNNFRKHIFRKFTCKPILNEVDILEIQNEFKVSEDTKYPHLSSLYPHKNEDISGSKIKKSKSRNSFLLKNGKNHEDKKCT